MNQLGGSENGNPLHATPTFTDIDSAFIIGMNFAVKDLTCS
jgi:hypothetical protein